MLTKEDKIKLIELELKALKKVIELAPEVEKVLRKFDGKQANKRLDTALKKIDSNLRFEIHSNSFDVTLYIQDRSLQTEDKGRTYIDYKKTVLGGCVESAYGDGICQNGTLIADIAIKELYRMIDYHKQTVKNTEVNINEIEEFENQKQEIKTKIENHNDSIPYLLDKYFGLRINIHR